MKNNLSRTTACWRNGFSFLEIIMVIAILAIIAKLGLMSYQSYQISANKQLAQHALEQDVSILEKYYAQNGAYLDANGNWPSAYLISVAGTNGHAYSISFYPSTASAANHQAYCLVATPASNSAVTDNTKIYIDRSGTISLTIPDTCQDSSLNVSSIDPNNLCANSSTSYLPCSGNCSGGVYSACSGNCDKVTVCAGGTGCSGNCRNSVIYGGCSGECINSTIYNGCSGHCTKSICCDNSGNCSACK